MTKILPEEAKKIIEIFNKIKVELKIVPNKWKLPIIEPPCPPPCLYANPTHDFGDKKRGEVDIWSFPVLNKGGGTLIWNVDAGKDEWIKLQPTSGTDSGTVIVLIDTTKLNPSNDPYEGTVTVRSNDKTNRTINGKIKVSIDAVDVG